MRTAASIVVRVAGVRAGNGDPESISAPNESDTAGRPRSIYVGHPESGKTSGRMEQDSSCEAGRACLQ